MNYIIHKTTHNAYNCYLNTSKIVNKCVIIKCVHLHPNVFQKSSFRSTAVSSGTMTALRFTQWLMKKAKERSDQHSDHPAG